ncbi:MAG: hypothetical protein C5B55_06410, partial [Blastocatellia bacterium]
MKRIAAAFARFAHDKKSQVVLFAGVVTILVVAAFSISRISYSNPQDTGTKQWLIEFKTGEPKVQLTLHYSRERDGGFS